MSESITETGLKHAKVVDKLASLRYLRADWLKRPKQYNIRK